MMELLRRGIKNWHKIPSFLEKRAGDRLNLITNRFPPLWTLKGSYDDSLVVDCHPKVSQPVLDGSEISDFSADWVADPFLHYENDTYFLFAEAAKERYPSDGACLVWYESPDGLNWQYQGIVLDIQPKSDMTDSYPQVLEHKNEKYLIPSFARGNENINDLHIYRFIDFPSDVELIGASINGLIRGDPTVFAWKNNWYCIFEDFDYNLQLYYTDSLLNSNWKKHPQSPIESNRKLRPGGRPIIRKNCVEFFTQGPRANRTGLLYYNITRLSPEEFQWVEKNTSPILYPASHPGRWNEWKMHHIGHLFNNNRDHNDIIAVDGQDRWGDYSIGIYHTSPQCNYP